MPFQSTVNLTPAPAVAGDFASGNPRNSVDAGQGAFVAGPQGLVSGLFAWVDTATNSLASNAGTGAPTGFVHREQIATITTYLAESGNVIQPGMPVTLFSAGDFWVRNAGAGAVAVMQKAFANNTNGTVSFAAPGATVAGATETKWYAQSVGAAGELVKISNVALG